MTSVVGRLSDYMGVKFSVAKLNTEIIQLKFSILNSDHNYCWPRHEATFSCILVVASCCCFMVKGCFRESEATA